MLEHPVIWDKSDAQHKNSFIPAKKWDEVANGLIVTSKCIFLFLNVFIYLFIKWFNEANGRFEFKVVE